MRDAGARRIKVDAVIACERFNICVLFQILRRNILNVVIDGEYRLRRIGNRCRADLLEFRNHRAGVVMRHHVARPNRDKVATPHHRIGSEPVSVASGNLLNQR
jgi:hypothetical protein